MSIENHPWLLEAIENLPDEMPAALLLYGQKGIGKDLLAQAIAQSLLCTESVNAGQACGRCDSCHLFAVGNHPDFRLLQPAAEMEEVQGVDTEKDSKPKKPSSQIGVPAVRDLAGLTSNVSHRGGSRVVIITPAEALNPSAGNALLKMLEEPGSDMHFILVTSERHRLLPTIKSRCFKLAVKPPGAETGAAWLREHHPGCADAALFLASGAPLAALKLSEDEGFWASRSSLMTGLAQSGADPLELAGMAEKLEPATLGRLLTMWVFDLLALQQGGEVRYHRDMQAELNRLSGYVAGPDLCRWNDQVRDFTRSASHPLNRRLALESLFAGWPGSGISSRPAGFA
jgi:DNA polymerase-3 subunit delta'